MTRAATRAEAAPIERVLAALEAIAPLALAAPWDNVGLLVPPAAHHTAVSRLLVTIDLSEEVLDEAIASGADLVVAYHPPIFEAKKRFRADHASDRVVLGAIRAGVGVFSPHTSLDAAAGRMTDWLAGALGKGDTRVIAPHPGIAGAGMGRIVTYRKPLAMDDVVARIKKHLGVGRLRVALPARVASTFRVGSAAYCPGAGGPLFDAISGVDLLVTGEMRHHDVLAHVARGRAVVLAEHSNSERGYLPHYARAIRASLPGVTVSVATRDHDPLRVR